LSNSLAQLNQDIQQFQNSFSPEQHQHEMRQAHVVLDQLQRDVQEITATQTAHRADADKTACLVSQLTANHQSGGWSNQVPNYMQPMSLPKPNLLDAFPGSLKPWGASTCGDYQSINYGTYSSTSLPCMSGSMLSSQFRF